MKVKLLVSRCGPDVMQNRGDEVEVGDAEAVRMVRSEQAVAIDEDAFRKAAADYDSAMAAELKEAASKTEKAVSKAKPEKAVK